MQESDTNRDNTIQMSFTIFLGHLSLLLAVKVVATLRSATTEIY